MLKVRTLRSFTRIVCLAALLVSLGSAPVVADVWLPAVIGEHMVLQRETEVPIWGKAEPGERVTVSADWLDKPVATTTNSGGWWRVPLLTPGAGGPHSITIAGNNKITLENVMIGEVWVCSGQSNMEWSVSAAEHAEEEAAAAKHPRIRLFHVRRATSGQPLTDLNAKWAECSPEQVKGFSAVAYFFGRELHRELDVPIGLIATSWGGTRIEPWTPPTGFAAVPALTEVTRQIDKANGEYREAVKASLGAIEDWTRAARKAVSAGGPIPTKPALPKHELDSHAQPTGLYNAMVHPLVPFGIRGAIWYQGEANRFDGMMYHDKMKGLIAGWRQQWSRGDFPFLYVQLAPFRYQRHDAKNELGSVTNLPRIWEAQAATLAVPNTGMAVTTDIGNIEDIHPRNKQDVGRRLALWALAKTYSRDGLVHSGPLFKSMAVEGSRIRLRFDHTGSGLASRDGSSLSWFTIAGADREFVEAEANADDDSVIVSSVLVPEPVAVRFGWHELAEPNLMNKEGLPASPFRTDHWPKP